MKNPYEEIERNIARTIDYLTGITGVDSPKQLGELHSMILQALDACMEQKYPLMDTDHITSSEVLLHVKDRVQGVFTAENFRLIIRKTIMDSH